MTAPTLPDDVREKVRAGINDTLFDRYLADDPWRDNGPGDAVIDKFLLTLDEAGLVVVPREPTEERIKAVEFALYRHADCSARDAERAAPQVYLAAIAASEEKG